MARDTRSIVKMSRREGYALHPKAHKALVKRPTPPGQHGNSRNSMRNKASQYSLQLREKQKVKRLYGLLEKQFSNLMKEATRREGQSGQNLLQLLEQRLDNAVYRAGFAPSRRAARQLVTHGHFMMNGVRVDVPSIRVKAGDELIVRDHSKATEYFKKLDDVSPAPPSVPEWVKVERKKLSFKVTGIPTREDAEPDIKEQLIVEYYSR
ncbi:MAG TPA: 30S ribosomal protein S4 [Patescibacteria group bacterium]|nr:30S ribosomal protein S4 [Patescibacteria group bacterium]HSX00067.1 30S ribosomal protein S4 [Patescibacteria group bacterium]